MKYLGVSLDQKLSFADHIEEITKMKRVTNCFYNLKKFSVVKLLYSYMFNHVQSNLYHGVLVYGTANITEL